MPTNNIIQAPPSSDFLKEAIGIFKANVPALRQATYHDESAVMVTFKIKRPGVLGLIAHNPRFTVYHTRRRDKPNYGNYAYLEYVLSLKWDEGASQYSRKSGSSMLQLRYCLDPNAPKQWLSSTNGVEWS